MLEFQLDNYNPLFREGITCFLCDGAVDEPPQPFKLDFCYCGFECEDNLKVFSGSNEREKDYFTLYHKSEDEDLELSFFINETELLDGVHGVAIDNGFIVDWTLVSQTLGYGLYTLYTNINEFGVQLDNSVGKFNLMPFSIEEANGTVKIKTVHDGDLEHKYDFNSESVPFEIRLPAIFSDRQKVDEYEDFLNRNRDTEQIHDRWWYEYTLSFTMRNKDLLDLLLNQYLSGETIEISDYNIFNHVTYDKQLVRLRSTEIEEHQGTTYATYSIGFEDYKKNKIKHPKYQ